MDLITTALVLLCCVFLSGVEITFTAADRLRLELELQKNSFSSRFLAVLLRNPDRWLATMLVLYNGFLVVLTMGVADWLHTHLYPDLTDEYMIEFLDISIITILAIIFVELIPKTIFQLSPTRTLILLSLPIYALQVLFRPVVSLFMFISYKLLFWAKLDFKKEQITRFGKKDLEHFLNNINDQTGIDETILHNTLELNELNAKGCMTPIKEVLSIELNASLEQLTALFIEHRYTRVMVYEREPSNLVGYFHHHYLLQNPNSIAQYMFRTQTVAENSRAHDLLHQMINEKLNVVVVVNKEQQQIGIVALADLLELIFGQMEEEFED